MVKNQFYLFSARRFLPLFIAQFFAMLNDSAFKYALIMLATFKFSSEPKTALLIVNSIAGIYTLPFLFFSASAGQINDKYNKTFLIRCIKLFEVFCMCLALIGFYFENIKFLIFILFLMGVHSTFLMPIKYSILPNLLKEDELLGGNALIEAGSMIALLFGVILGVLLGATMKGVWIISALSLLLSVLGWTSSLFVPNVRAADPELRLNPNFLSEIGKLVRHTFHHTYMVFTMLKISWLLFISFIVIRQFPVLAKTVGGNQFLVAWLLSVFALGIVCGALFCNRLLKGKIHDRFVPFSLFFIAIFTFDLSLATNFTLPIILHPAHPIQEFLSVFQGWRISIDIFIIALASGIYIVPLYALIQNLSPLEYRSRFMACNNLFGSFFGVTASLLVIFLVKLNFSIAKIFLVTAFFNCFVLLFIMRKKIRRT